METILDVFEAQNVLSELETNATTQLDLHQFADTFGGVRLEYSGVNRYSVSIGCESQTCMCRSQTMPATIYPSIITNP